MWSATARLRCFVAVPALLLLTPLWMHGQNRITVEGSPAGELFVQAGFESGSYLGVGLKDINAESAKALKLKEEYGVEVTRVDEESPAAKAGLQPHDAILTYNGQRVEGSEQLVRFVRETPVGRTVKLGIVRDGAPQTLTAVVGSRKMQFSFPDMNMKEFHFEMPDLKSLELSDLPQARMSWRNSSLGVEAESLGETQLADYFGVKQGVLVRSVIKGTAAEKAGLKAGDVLVKVDATPVSTPRDITNALRASRTAGKTALPVALVREHKDMTLQVAMPEVKSPAPAVRGERVSHRGL